MPKNPKIHFIITGGTIDSYYDGTKDTVVTHKQSIIPKYLKNLKLHIDAKYTQICMKDSRDLKIEDMEKVRSTIDKSKDKYFIVTHGTYCMPDTGRYLEKRLKRKNAVILLTGSLIPLEAFAGSDALFNLGYSIAEIFHLKPGIHVCMNGRIFSPGEIAKLIGQGQFVSIMGN
ncbi:asparaginase [Candidatus Woesearchaeota archaeon]|nr:asparaginase [Candidatus Woesearchaeota archaeon]